MRQQSVFRLRRIAPGFYVSSDGRVQIHGWQRPEADGYGPAGERMWYFLIDGVGGDDLYYTKREAVEAAQAMRNQPVECAA